MPALVKDYASTTPLKAAAAKKAVTAPKAVVPKTAPTLPSLPSSSGYGLSAAINGGGGSTTTTTVTPNQVYQSQIDAAAEPAVGIFNTQASNLANARADAIQRAIVNAGWTPQLTGALSGFSGDVTQATLDQAAANPMSQKAQLDLQLSQARANTPYDLAATGADRSGALPIQLGNLSRGYDAASYQDQQDLLSAITNAGSTYAGGYSDAQAQLEAARRDIANTLAQQAGYSESIVTSPAQDNWLPDPNGNTANLSPSYPAPAINKTVQKAITALGYKPAAKAPATLYRTIRQAQMGG